MPHINALQVRAIRLLVDRHEEVAPSTVVPALEVSALPVPAQPAPDMHSSSGLHPFWPCCPPAMQYTVQWPMPILARAILAEPFSCLPLTNTLWPAPFWPCYSLGRGPRLS